MTRAASYWFRIVEGEDFIRRLTWYTDDTMTAPVNLTGYHASFIIDLSGTDIITVTDGHGITLGGATGTIDIKVPSATFAAAPAFSSARYRLMYTNRDGDLLCLLFGQFTKDGQT